MLTSSDTKTNEMKTTFKRWIHQILVFLYGFIIGGIVSIFWLDEYLREIWKAGNTTNVQLFNLLDDIVGYYILSFCLLAILMVFTVGMRLQNRKHNRF